MSTISTASITTPAPILRIDNNIHYPIAPTMSSSHANTTSTISNLTTTTSITSPTLHYHIQTGEKEKKECIILTSNSKKQMYYYQEPSILQEAKEQKEEVIFYNQYQKPIWKLINRDWHGMTLIYQQLTITLSTTPPPQFKFTFQHKVYYWQAFKQQPYILKCFEADTKKLIAQLSQTELLLDILPIVSVITEETNPFRKSSLQPTENNTTEGVGGDDPFITLVILSGLLVNHHIKILLKSLGGGPEALEMILGEAPPSTVSPQEQQEEENEEDDITSLSSARQNHYYPGHQSLVEGNQHSRWSSSAQSFKSIELDPGVWHCWWGYKFWWNWFPCCMPGGCCDRICIRLKGTHSSKSSRTRTLSKQGWQQQHY